MANDLIHEGAPVSSPEVKMYSDYKSPYAFLAFDPAFALEERYRVRVRWIPFQLRIKGKGERSLYSEHKARYSYLDARRWAKPRGIVIRGPPRQAPRIQQNGLRALLQARARG
jgi:2-hydroxychromene-2-carboxylate isomerase